jgi:hypothetical protein
MPDLAEQLRAHATWIDERGPDFDPATIRECRTVDVESKKSASRSHRRLLVVVAAAVLVALVTAAAVIHVRQTGSGVTTVNQPTGPAWVEAPDLNIPTAQGWIGTRVQPIWTGREVLLVGELVTPFAGFDPKVDAAHKISTLLGIPAYDPGTRRWRIIPKPPVDLYSTNFSAVWAGDRLIVIGPTPATSGSDGIGAGAAYDPATNRWTIVAAPPSGQTLDGVAVWTGHDVVTWTAEVGVEAYTPLTDSWRALTHEVRSGAELGSRQPGDPPRANEPTAIWNGHEMVVTGDVGDTVSAFDPTNDRWRDLPVPPTGVGGPLAWTGRYLGAGDASQQVTWFDPATSRWLSQEGPASFRDRFPFGATVWVGDHVVALGGSVRHHSTESTAVVSTADGTGQSLDLATGVWHAIPDLPYGILSITHAAVAGDLIFAWGEDQPSTLVSHRTIRAATLATRALETGGAPSSPGPSPSEGTTEGAGAIATPAALRASLTCQADGTYRITWSLTNHATGRGSQLTIRSASLTDPARFGGAPSSVTFVPSDLASGTTATASTTIAGTKQDKLSVTVTYGLTRNDIGFGGELETDLPGTCRPH